MAKDLEDKFAVVEQRVRSLIAENEGLNTRINELEQELHHALLAAREIEQYNGTKQQIRKKIETILHALETIHVKK